jgi:eukaryotic-like serine/threonine-protein kinase
MNQDSPSQTKILGLQTRSDRTVDSLLELFLQRIEQDPDLSPESFLKDYPNSDPSLPATLATIHVMHRAGRSLRGASAETIPEPLSQLGDFQVERVLGRGGMGIVFLAKQRSLNRLVALKVLPSSLAIDPIGRQRFQLEAQVAAKLEHPNIIPVYAIGNENGIDYFAMQFIDGVSLSQLIHGQENDCYLPPDSSLAQDKSTDLSRVSSTGKILGSTTGAFRAGAPGSQSSVHSPPLTPIEVAKIGLSIADALAAAHQQGIIHRDIKPSNILLDAKGKPYVGDFGLAHVEQDSQLTTPGTVLGSFRYMSPEQLEPQRWAVDARCDIYSLGATLYELLTLQNAVGGDNRRQIAHNRMHEEVIAPRKLNPSIPVDLSTIVVKALQRDRRERYASAADMAADLQAFLDHRPISARKRSIAVQFSRWARRNTAIAALSIALALILVTATIVSTRVAYNMNRLAGDIKTTLERVEQERSRAESMSRLLINAFRSPDPAVDGRTFTVAQMLTKAQENVFADATIDDQARAELLDAIGQSLRGLGDFKESLRVHQACFDLRRKTLGPDKLPTLQSMTRLALAHRDVGELPTSIELYQQALRSLRKNFSDDHPDTLDTIGALAMAHQDNQQLDLAQPLHQESLQRRVALFGADSASALQAMNNWALWLQESNRHQEAYELHLQTYQGREKRFTKRHPDTIQSMANLAGAMQDVGKSEEALELQAETLQLHREVLGDNHPNTLIALNNSALFFAEAGDQQRAIELFEEVLAKMRAKLSDTHQDTLIAMGNLAHFYFKSGRIDEAIQLGLERLAAELANRGPRNPIVANCHAQLGSCYLKQGQLTAARQHMQSAVDIRLAEQPEAWSTFRDMSKLGEILSAQKQYELALPLLLDGYQKLAALAEAIPATARQEILNDAAGRIVQFYREQGQEDLAAPYLKEIKNQ